MNYKILIVEDEFVTANALRLLLEKAGHCVTDIASSAQEAYKSLQKQKPDLVLLDIRLEGKETGIQLAGKLRDMNIGFVYLSANSSQDVLEEAKKTEPYGFLVKPYRGKDVLVALEIAYYLHSSNLESRIRQQEMLQRQLVDLRNSSLEPHQTLLQTARILQPHIPFDLILTGVSTGKEASGFAYGYIRTGYDEYELINEKGYSYDATQATVSALDLSGTSTVTPFQNILREHYRISSYLNFPVRSGNEVVTHYFFCSRKPDAYHQQHLDLISGPWAIPCIPFA
jgi:CheY-like chemotaxis protein